MWKKYSKFMEVLKIQGKRKIFAVPRVQDKKIPISLEKYGETLDVAQLGVS